MKRFGLNIGESFMKKINKICLISIMMAAIFVFPSFGMRAKEVEKNEDIHVITGFDKYNVEDHTIYESYDDKPELKDILSSLPNTIDAYVDELREKLYGLLKDNDQIDIE